MNRLKLLLLLIIVAMTSVVSYAASSDLIERLKGTPQIFPKQKMESKIISSDVNSVASSSAVMKSDESSPIAPIATLSGADTWGSLSNISDGTIWFYTQTFETINQFYYSKSVITVYDNNFNESFKVTVEIPEDMKVNSIEPLEYLTNRFFDRDANTLELMVFVHTINEQYTPDGIIEVYSQASEKLYSYDAQSVMFFDASVGFSTYQRMIFYDESTEYVDGTADSTETISIYKPATWSAGPQVEHTFTLDMDNCYYMDGPIFAPYNLDGTPYYVISHYEMPYMSGYDETSYDPIVQENNNFVIEIYDKNFKTVKNITIPVSKADDALYGFEATGVFSSKYNFTKGVFSGDDKLNIVVNHYDYITSTDSYIHTYSVYDEDGNKVKTICDNTSMWLSLMPIKGYEDQYAFLQTVNEEQQLKLVNVPSCETETIIPAYVEGDLISTNINRFPYKDSYKYLISLGEAIADEENNVIARIGWYNREDLSLDRMVKFNLGPNGEMFIPNVSSYAIDPFLVDTDSEHEYMYIAKVQRENSTSLENILVLANEDGSEIASFAGQTGSDKGVFRMASVFGYESASPILLLTYQNETTDQYTIDFYPLPFSKFANGGNGTEANPYLISTVGDFEQVAKDTDAYYKVINDIDFATSPRDWNPIGSFTGNLDGGNYSLFNVYLSGNEDYYGLFASLEEGASVKNLTLVSPEMTVGEQTYYSGILAASASSATVENVHIYDALINGSTSGNVGGVLGYASVYTEIKSCSFKDGEINTPNAENVGGICGSTQTSTNVTAAAVTGNITASTIVGGIVGSTGMDSKVTDSRADVNISAKNVVGGIVGNSERALISKCYAAGTVRATEANQWSNAYSAGGIVGALASDWTHTPSVVVENCVAAQSSVFAPGTKAVHRIAGFTIADETYEAGETVYTETGLSNNFASSELQLAGNTIQSTDATSVEGGDKIVAEMNKDYFTALGYTYGSDSAAPWYNADPLPILYYEAVAQSVELSDYALSMTTGETADLTATIYGTFDGNISFESSNTAVVTVGTPVIDGNSATVSLVCVAEGNAVITVKVGEIVTSCIVTGVSGVESIITDDSASIVYDGVNVVALGAKQLRLYSIYGTLATSVNSDSLSVESVAPGIYVAVADDANGNTSTLKLVVK